MDTIFMCHATIYWSSSLSLGGAGGGIGGVKDSPMLMQQIDVLKDALKNVQEENIRLRARKMKVRKIKERIVYSFKLRLISSLMTVLSLIQIPISGKMVDILDKWRHMVTKI